MGELDIQIKVLKENTPILFSWWNKEKDILEGCFISCQCQDFGLYYASNSKSFRNKRLDDFIEVFSQEGVIKFAEALQQAEVVTLPKGAENGSVLQKKKRKTCIWGSTVTGTDEGGGSSKQCEEDKAADTRIGREECRESDGAFESINPEERDGIQSERECRTEIVEKDSVIKSTKQKNRSGSKIGETGNVKAKRAGDKQDCEIDGGFSDPTALILKDEKDGGRSEKMLDTHNGEDQCDKDSSIKINGVKTCDDGTEGNHQLVEDSEVNLEGNTAPIIPVNHGVTGIVEDVASVDQMIDVGTFSPESEVVLDENKGIMSEVDRALYEALKGIIEVSQAAENGTSSCHQVPQPSNNPPKKLSELDFESPSDPDPVLKINTPAMIKYHEHKNEEYLKRLHQLCSMKKVVTIVCEICGALRTNKSFPNHMAAYHSKEERERNYVCEVCGKKFLRPRNLQRHLLTHTDYRAYCSYCGKSFKHDYNRKAHEKIHWEKPPPPPVRKPRYKTLNPKIRRKPSEIDEEYRNSENRNVKELLKQEGPSDPKCKTVACSTCGKVVSRKSIRRHIRNHYLKNDSDDSAKSENKSLNTSCKVCGKVLRQKNLKLHMNTVHNPRLLKCGICGKMVKNGSMYGHAKLHTPDKPHACSYCSARFHFKSCLDAHLRKHTKEKPIQCRFCDRTFARYETRLNHERRHTGERPYKCNLCQKDWKDRGAYKQHMLKYHPGVPMMLKRGPYAPQNQGILEVTEETEISTE